MGEFYGWTNKGSGESNVWVFWRGDWWDENVRQGPSRNKRR
jgi:hypothetical protein